jgi:hypothetical protein
MYRDSRDKVEKSSFPPVERLFKKDEISPFCFNPQKTRAENASRNDNMIKNAIFIWGIII